MGAVSLDYAAPDAALRDYLSLFYEFRADVEQFDDVERADLAQFRFMLSGEGEIQFADGHVQQASGPILIGPTTGMTKISIRGPVHVFGFGLLPAGWGVLIGIGASTLVNRVVDATQLFGQRLDLVADQLRAAPTFDAKVAIGSAFASDLAARADHHSLDFTRIVDGWLAATFSPEVDCLVERCGLSRRQVERNCKKLYGAPPKVLARKYRALRAAVSLAKGDVDMQDVVSEGFYDQSHLIREIKHFTGVTPRQMREETPELTRLTMRRTEWAGKVADPNIWET